LSALLLPERVSETETLIVRGLRRVYEPLLNFAVTNEVLTLGGAAVLVVFAVLGVQGLGHEFQLLAIYTGQRRGGGVGG
jgi:heavy metal efflux system protein